jgi:hypothetical protein
MLLKPRRVPYAECGETLVSFRQQRRKSSMAQSRASHRVVDGRTGAIRRRSCAADAEYPDRIHHAEKRRQNNICVLTFLAYETVPARRTRTKRFCLTSSRCRGYTPVVVNPAEAALLATCSNAGFTGMSIVVGAETTTVCVARLGIVLASETIAVGGNWIDSEMCRQFKVQMFDETGNAYLDLESIRQWKIDSSPHLINTHGDRERQLSRLYAVVQERIVGSIRELTAQSSVRTALNKQRLTSHGCRWSSDWCMDSQTC